MREIKIEESWKNILSQEFKKDYFNKLREKVREEYLTKKICPPARELFEAFNVCPFEKVKVVILGQDPYHNKGQAHGLSFSVKEGVKLPPSLQNIFKEIESDLKIIPKRENGNLIRWAQQGVFLLNSILTVEENKPTSHKNIGWETFTDSVIRIISQKKENIVFILWGNFAKGKASLIEKSKHLIISSAHPSPFSASYGFFGSRPFSQTNNYLKEHNIDIINWE